MHGAGDGVEVVVEQVPVRVECHHGGRVSEHPLDGFHVRAGADGERGSGVAEVVLRPMSA